MSPSDYEATMTSMTPPKKTLSPVLFSEEDEGAKPEKSLSLEAEPFKPEPLQTEPAPQETEDHTIAFVTTSTEKESLVDCNVSRKLT